MRLIRFPSVPRRPLLALLPLAAGLAGCQPSATKPSL